MAVLAASARLGFRSFRRLAFREEDVGLGGQGAPLAHAPLWPRASSGGGSRPCFLRYFVAKLFQRFIESELRLYFAREGSAALLVVEEDGCHFLAGLAAQAVSASSRCQKLCVEALLPSDGWHTRIPALHYAAYAICRSPKAMNTHSSSTLE